MPWTTDDFIGREIIPRLAHPHIVERFANSASRPHDIEFEQQNMAGDLCFVFRYTEWFAPRDDGFNWFWYTEGRR